jgi:HK97 family phage major capsid protein
MNGWINKKVPAAIDFAVNYAIVQGTGAGMPLGILNSPALITVAAESGQAASTIVANNIEKMWSRCEANCRSTAIWLANQSIEPQLFKLTHLIRNAADNDNVGGWPLYMPPGGLSAQPYSTLMGRPIVWTQACEALGSLGDLILVCPDQYITAVKTPGGVRQDVSIHVFFDYAVTSFRFIIRLGGQPAWTKPMSDRSGSYTYSPFVALAQRP